MYEAFQVILLLSVSVFLFCLSLVLLVMSYKIYRDNIVDRLLKAIEAVAEKYDGTSRSISTGGFVSSVKSETSRSDRKVPSIDALPPEVIAPSLKGMQKTSGFGANKSKKASDT